MASKQELPKAPEPFQEEVQTFPTERLKHVDPEEKVVLPSKEGSYGLLRTVLVPWSMLGNPHSRAVDSFRCDGDGDGDDCLLVFKLGRWFADGLLYPGHLMKRSPRLR
ncbi:unnamed protein product [Soboliphyme baturini]|uniref:Uncharacterized protein n=1 Tax=Soboliphyme baturini TaxID=241478 RepID=A0A183IVK6_9BILA|nr:unnamed protein product [Soboliphyme baturini]